MSEKGAKDFIISVFWTALLYLSFMLPVIIGCKFLSEHITAVINPSYSPDRRILNYLLWSIGFFAVMFLLAYIQYDSAYTRIYGESAKRRISLAETLRKLPLAFFGKKDIADLSSTIMEDATQIEQLFSHTVPELYASIINVFIICIMLFLYNWKMALSVFWVLPAAALVFFLSRKFQNRSHKQLYDLKRGISDNIQEELDLIHEIKAYNRESFFTGNLNGSLDGYEKILIKNELLLGTLINLSYVVLKLGLPSVILTGAYMLSAGTIGIFTYLVFLIIASRIYNPVMQAFDNFAALIFLNVRIKRMKEMDSMPRQEGRSEFKPENYDIEFKNVDFSYLEDVQTLKNVSLTAKTRRSNRSCRSVGRRKKHRSQTLGPLLGY